jgi:uncharacterized membrane protein YidH (DUF202 family)
MEKFNLLEGRTKEWNSTNYQGRRKDQYESNMKTTTMGCIGMLIVIVSLIIYGIVS